MYPRPVRLLVRGNVGSPARKQLPASVSYFRQEGSHLVFMFLGRRPRPRPPPRPPAPGPRPRRRPRPGPRPPGPAPRAYSTRTVFRTTEYVERHAPNVLAGTQTST